MANQRSFRQGRVNDVLQRELAILIRDHCKDPRVGFVTLSGVEVSKDLSVAKVFLTVLEEGKANETVKVLNQAAGFFRGLLAKEISLRIVPKLIFVLDKSIAEGAKIEALIAKTRDQGKNSEK